MGWPYPFPAAQTAEELEARRHTLDKFGIIAQLSAIAVIIGIALYQWIFNRKHTSFKSASEGPVYARVPMDTPGGTGAGQATDQDDGMEMQSPGHFAEALQDNEDALDETEQEGLVAPSPAQTTPRVAQKAGSAQKSQLAAWLDMPLRQGWRETRRHMIAVGIWSVWIVSLVFRQTGSDYLHVTKRFAKVAVSILPFHYLLGTSSRFSPLPFLFRTSPSHLYNAYHRIHAVLILFLLASHASWYVNFYYWVGKLPSRLLDLVPFLGLVMITIFISMAILARQAIRYNPKTRFLFVNSHVLAAGLIPAILWFHATPGRWAAVESLIVFAMVVAEKVLRRREGSG